MAVDRLDALPPIMDYIELLEASEEIVADIEGDLRALRPHVKAALRRPADRSFRVRWRATVDRARDAIELSRWRKGLGVTMGKADEKGRRPARTRPTSRS
jgi:hypothetical protein